MVRDENVHYCDRLVSDGDVHYCDRLVSDGEVNVKWRADLQGEVDERHESHVLALDGCGTNDLQSLSRHENVSLDRTGFH